MSLALAGLVASVLGTAASGVGSYLGNKKMSDITKRQREESSAFYNKEIYQDAIKRADTQSFLRQLADQMKESTQRTDMSTAISGGTAEASLAQKGANMKSYADAISKLTGQAQQRKDYLTSAYRGEKRGFDQQEANLEAQKLQNWGNLASNAAMLGAASLMNPSLPGTEVDIPRDASMSPLKQGDYSFDTFKVNPPSNFPKL